MPITYYDDVDQMVSVMEAALPDDVIQRLSKEVGSILLKHIKTDIYDAYTPKEGAWVNGTTYSRRHVLEGGIKSTVEADGVLVTTSDAPAGQCVVKGYKFSNADSGFLQLLESGHMGIWRHGFARPAVSNAQKEVDSSSKIRSILESRMKVAMNK